MLDTVSVWSNRVMCPRRGLGQKQEQQQAATTKKQQRSTTDGGISDRKQDEATEGGHRDRPQRQAEAADTGNTERQRRHATESGNRERQQREEQLVLKNKKLFQSHISPAVLGQTTTGAYSYKVWVWQRLLVITTNKWDLSRLAPADKGWLTANACVVHVAQKLYVPPAASSSP